MVPLFAIPYLELVIQVLTAMWTGQSDYSDRPPDKATVSVESSGLP